MAVLHLLLQHDPRARAHEGLEAVCVRHDWVEGKQFLLVPYHMIGARSMESAILGGYADHVRKLHPEAPWPGIYLADDLFEDARRCREQLGDETFFGRSLGSRPAADSKWGKRAAAWDARAVRGRDGRPARRRGCAASSSATWSSTCSRATAASRPARPSRSCRSTRA